MKLLVLIFLAFFSEVLSFGQRPTAYDYHNLSASADGTVLYGSSSISGTMSGGFPRGVITHTYTASFTLTGPPGSGIAPVSCSISQSGDPGNNFDPACYLTLSFLGIGTFSQNLEDSATCSYAGTFYTNSGTTAQSPGNYPNLTGIVTLTLNPDSSYTAGMSLTDFQNFQADAQEYFQSECGCPDISGILSDLNKAVIAQTVKITVTTAVGMANLLVWMNKQSPEAHNTPISGQPNSVKVFDKSTPTSTGKNY